MNIEFFIVKYFDKIYGGWFTVMKVEKRIVLEILGRRGDNCLDVDF